jgi:hypothetical protein
MPAPAPPRRSGIAGLRDDRPALHCSRLATSGWSWVEPSFARVARSRPLSLRRVNPTASRSSRARSRASPTRPCQASRSGRARCPHARGCGSQCCRNRLRRRLSDPLRKRCSPSRTFRRGPQIASQGLVSGREVAIYPFWRDAEPSLARVPWTIDGPDGLSGSQPAQGWRRVFDRRQ